MSAETGEIVENDAEEEIQEADERENPQEAEAVATAQEAEGAENERQETEEAEPVYHEDVIHSYELIVVDVAWTEAYNSCIARRGHLVRINSDEEYQAILEQIAYEEKNNIKFWLGGARSAEEYEYRWIWNDVPNDLLAVVEYYSGTVGYICEYED